MYKYSLKIRDYMLVVGYLQGCFNINHNVYYRSGLQRDIILE